MNVRNFAALLNGREYKHPQFTEAEIGLAKKNGFVIVYGASDDLMEFEGAICDEAGCWDGGTVHFTETGVDYDETAENCIIAKWCEDKDVNGKVISWTYETDITHEEFDIYEDGVVYCRGIVFSIDDLKEE